MPIDLAQPRVFALTGRGRHYTMTCKPITKAMWLKYFAGIVSTSETKGGETTNAFDSVGARLQLLESALTDASGYTKDGESIASINGWQGKLPMGHRLAVAGMLADVEVVPPSEEDGFELGLETVSLQALWSADAAGQMQQVSGLKHVFMSPTAAHQVRYSRAMSRSVVSGGRHGVTRWLGAQDVLIELYDELIHRADGYEFDGKTVFLPGDDRAACADRVDAYHKVVAATALFTPVEVDTQ